MSAKTRRAYATDLTAWDRWCHLEGVQALPADGDDLTSHLADLAGTGAAVSSLNRRLAAILKAHRLTNQPVPDTGRPHEAIRAHRRRKLEAKRLPRSVDSIGPTELAAKIDQLDFTTLHGVLDGLCC